MELKQEIDKLKSGDVILQIGKKFLDVPDAIFVLGLNSKSSSLRGFSIDGDSNQLSNLLTDITYQFYFGERNPFINLLIIDCKTVSDTKKHILAWKDFVIPGGVLFFYNTDNKDIKNWLDQYFDRTWKNYGNVGRVIR